MKYKLELENVKEYVRTSINLSEVLNKLGIPRQGNNSKTLRKYLDDNKIDYSHFTGRARTYKIKKEVSLNDIFSNKYSYNNRSLKNRLLKAGYKKYECEECGISKWLGKEIVLQLHHKDGNNKNNSLENLKLLCPNCHSLTENFCGNKNKNIIKYFCPDCGKEIKKNSKYCSMCSAKYSRKVERPTKDELLVLLHKVCNFSKIGKLYGVTDNTIRKWCQRYNLPYKTSDYKQS